MTYYPLLVLMPAGITEIAIVSSPAYLPDYPALFGGGAALGLRIDYVEQPRPEGLPQAFTLARDWIAGEPVTLILGDNIFYDNGLIDAGQARALAAGLAKSPYGAAILKAIQER